MDIQTLKKTINAELGRYGAFSETFWRFVKTEVGITHIYENKHSYLKKQVSFEERQRRVEELVARADYDDDKLNPSDQELAKWSEEALELNQIIKKLGLNKDICSREYLYKFFKTFYAQRNAIEELDGELANFGNLQVLNLSNNKICRVQNLPPNLQELNLTGNCIREVELLERPIESLLHLGMAYNCLTEDQLASISANFPKLFCLNLSFNQICNFQTALTQLEQLGSIKMLYLNGNPLQMTHLYREIVKQRLQDLRMLDGTQAFSEQEENQKKKFRKRVQQRLAHLGDIPPEAFKVPQDELIPIVEEVKIEIEFRLLQNVAGVFINDQNCQQLETLNLDEVPKDRKATQYWIKYTDHFGDEVVSEKKSWLEHFQVDLEKGIGRCDLDHTLKLSEPPSVELRDWLLNDIYVELICSQPIFTHKMNEEEQPVKDVQLDEQGQPETEEKVVGIMRLETSRLIMNHDLQEADLAYHKFGRFYDDNLRSKPEFMFKNCMVDLKENEVAMLEQALEQQELENERRNAITSQGSTGSKMEVKKGGKDAPKADKKAAAKGQTPVEDLNAPKPIEVEYEEIESEPDFMIIEKSFMGAKKPKAEKKESKAGTRSQAMTAQSATQGSDKGQTLEQKKLVRLAELQTQFDTIRAMPFSCAVKVNLNVYPKAEPEQPTPEASQAQLTAPPDSKTTGKQPASKLAGKKK